MRPAGRRALVRYLEESFRVSEREACAVLCIGRSTHRYESIADASGLPVAIDMHSSSPHEKKLVEATIKSRFIKNAPMRMIGDRAYDSDPLDQHLLRKNSTELIAPHKVNRKKLKSLNGRVLRRYKHRWEIERFFTSLYGFRRVVVRCEYHAQNFLGMLGLACAIIHLRYFRDEF